MSLNVRVSGHADFSQLKQELKQLNKDFGMVQNTTQKGIGQGFLGGNQARSLQFLESQMKKTIGTLDTLLDEQNQKVTRLEETASRAGGARRKELDKELEQRKAMVAQIQAEISAIENRTKALREQGDTLERVESSSPGSSGGSSGGGAGALSFLGLGKGLLGKVASLAGIAGIGSMLNQGVNGAITQQKSISQLGMRIGGANPNFQGLRTSIRDTGLETGYTGLESMQAVDAFTSRGGEMTRDDQAGLQGFSRAFGMDANQVSSTFGDMKRFGASESGKQREFAEMVATAIDRGAMQERAVEAMEATAGLVASMGDRMPELSAGMVSGALALQTLLNQTGVEGFRGERGANFTTKLDQLTQSGDPAVDFFTMRSLGWGDDKSWYDTQLQKEKGVYDPSNMRDIMKDIKKAGNSEMQDVFLMKATGMSLTEAKTFREKTNDYSDLTDGTLEGIAGSLGKGDSASVIDQKTAQWQESIGGTLTTIDARFDEVLNTIGNGLIPDFYKLKGIVSDIVGELGTLLDGDAPEAGGGLLGTSKTTTALAIGGAGLIAGGKIASTLLKGGSGLVNAGSKLIKGMPLIGGLISFGANKLGGDSTAEAGAKGVGAGVGAWAGGALGTLVAPGAGTVAGAVTGSMIGEWVGGKVYGFFGSQGTKEVTDAHTDGLEIMATDTKAELENITKEHKTFLTGMTDIWEALKEAYELRTEPPISINGLTGDNTGGGGRSFGESGATLEVETPKPSGIQRVINGFLGSNNTDPKEGGIKNFIDGFLGSSNNASNAGVGADNGGEYSTSWLSEYRKTSGFGKRNLFGRTFHSGLDLAMPDNTNIYSVGDGTVSSTGSNDVRGKFIKVKLESGETTTFQHLNAINVSKGQQVGAGDLIGKSGNTGQSTGSHLHLGIQDASGNYVDPEQWLQRVQMTTQFGGQTPTKSSKTTNINVTVKGSELNNKTKENLKEVVKEVVAEVEYTRFATTPQMS